MTRSVPVLSPPAVQRAKAQPARHTALNKDRPGCAMSTSQTNTNPRCRAARVLLAARRRHLHGLQQCCFLRCGSSKCKACTHEVTQPADFPPLRCTAAACSRGHVNVELPKTAEAPPECLKTLAHRGPAPLRAPRPLPRRRSPLRPVNMHPPVMALVPPRKGTGGRMTSGRSRPCHGPAALCTPPWPQKKDCRRSAYPGHRSSKHRSPNRRACIDFLLVIFLPDPRNCCQ